MTSYEKAVAELNPAQKEAVQTIEGPVLVVAGPGTGKTQLLSLRVANILQKTDTNASSILCLTFTNKASINMRDRLYRLIGPSSRNVVVRTFHSFAVEIMNQYPDYFWNGARLSVAPDTVQLEIIQTILAGLPLDNPLATTFAGTFTALHDVQQGLKLAKEAGLTPDELRATITANLRYIDRIEPKLRSTLAQPLSIKTLDKLHKAIGKLPKQPSPHGGLILPLDQVIKESLDFALQQDSATNKTSHVSKWKQRWLQNVDGKKGMFNERKRNAWWLAVADVYANYREQLHHRGYYDYSDMLIEVLEQLQTEADMRADLQERYLYVMIDEFQDTNAAQLRLSHLVADNYAVNNRPNLMAVGDDDQSIFAFNGAELNNMLSFQRSYPTSKLIVLTDNYRSTQSILDSATDIIEQAEDRLVKREPALVKNLHAKGTFRNRGSIKHFTYPTKQHQYAHVATQVQKLWQSGETSITVLARTHDSLRQLAHLLLSKKIPIRYEQQSNVLEQEAIKQVSLIIKVAVAIADGDKAIVNLGISELLPHPMWKLTPTTLWKLATANFSSPDWLESLLTHVNDDLRNIGNWLVWIARISRDQPLVLVLEYILGLQPSQYLESPLKDYYLSLRPVTSDYLEALSAIELLRGLVQEFAAGEAKLADFARFVELNLTTRRVIADESWFMTGEKAVQLLTIHKAKGLEFNVVFIIDATENMWRPHVSGRASPANLQLQSYGEKYDDYVRLLYVAASRARHTLVASSYVSDEKGNEILPTPLLSALPITAISTPKEDPVVVLESNLRWPHLSSHNVQSLLQDRLEQFSLSSTALIDFLNIAEAGPSSFMERHLLHLPRPRSAQGSYGSAIHAALETAQRLFNTNKLERGTVLDRFEAALQSEHLPTLDYERYRNRGLKLLKLLLKRPTLLLNRGSLAEQKINDITLKKARIKGKLDRIDVTPELLLISDYKTGKPLTNFDTHDQTKAIKAWRHRTQLLFYTLLTQHSSRFGTHKNIEAQMLYIESENPKHLSLSIQPEQAELEDLERLIEMVWQHIMKLDFPDVSGYSKDRVGIQTFIADLLQEKAPI